MNLKTIAVTAVLAGAIPLAVQACYLNQRITELEQERDIYSSRASNWSTRAIDDEEALDRLQQENETLTAHLEDLTAETQSITESVEGLTLTYAGDFYCTSYCTEKYKHICGTGTGITASGATVQAGVTVAADTSIFSYGTVLYIEGVGIRIVQDKGSGVQGNHLDIAVDTHDNALKWDGQGNHKVWVVTE